MNQCDANTLSIESFIEKLKDNNNFNEAFLESKTPIEAQKFVEFTFEVINTNKDYLQAAIFTFGREDLIPNMFTKIVDDINKKFPDFRSILIEVDQFRLSGQINLSNNTTDLKLRDDLYSFIFSKEQSFENIYQFVTENFSIDQMETLFDFLGKDFINNCISNKIESTRIFKIVYIICEHKQFLSNSIDPLIVGLGVIGKIRDILSD
jgi:hypothetical protein